MRSPVVHLAHNLRWTRYGTVWADWRIAGLPYGFRPDTDKQEIRALHQALLRALPGESLLASVATQVDPVDVVERMIAGIDLEQCPDWATECEATFDTLDQLAPGGRVFWLSVPLGHTSSWSWVTEATAAASTSVRDALALPRAPISEKEVDRRLTQAARIAAVLPAPFQPTPATPAQMLWLHLHAQQRGLTPGRPAPGVVR